MARKAFFSFHYHLDCWRASQVRNMHVIEGNSPISDNDWEKVKRGGDKAIERWIEEQLKHRTCTIVLVGKETSSRRWVKDEIKRSWELGKGIVGICIHNLLNSTGEQTSTGKNPFESFTVDGKKLSSIVKLYNPPYKISTYVYDHIKSNISEWVEEAIEIRGGY